MGDSMSTKQSDYLVDEINKELDNSTPERIAELLKTATSPMAQFILKLHQKKQQNDKQE